MTSLASIRAAIRGMKAELGDDNTPRHIIIYCGLHYTESWWERGPGNILAMYVRVPDWGCDPREYMPDSMRALIRPMDTRVVFEMAGNPRDADLQADRPPWKRTQVDRPPAPTPPADSIPPPTPARSSPEQAESDRDEILRQRLDDPELWEMP